MKKQHTFAGMNGGRCVYTVKQALLKIHDITEEEVLLQSQSAVLTMCNPLVYRNCSPNLVR